jgi:DNA-binding CsgD family transcriptional regulator
MGTSVAARRKQPNEGKLMTAPSLKLQYGAPLRRPLSRPGSPPAAPPGAGQPAPNADVLRLGRAPLAGASGPSLLAFRADAGAAAGPTPGAPDGEAAGAPGGVIVGPATPSGAVHEPPAPPASAVLPASGLAPEPHVLAAFAVALEAIDAPAFLTKPGGEIVRANGAARAWLERDRPGALASLHEARCAPKSHAFLIAPVPPAPGAEPWQLVAVYPQQDRDAERIARVAAAATRWALSARQREVLSLVVEGLSVPTIAAVLGCVEKTVGSHLNAIFKKALVESRAELTAKVWMG